VIEDDESVSSGGRESHGLPGIMPEEQINMLKRAHMQAEQRTALGPENRAEDGPDQDYASFPVFKDYAMASFTVLISSAVVEGFFSQFAGMKDKTRNLMADQTWSWSMWTRMAVPINSEPAEGFDLQPKLKDDARKDRLDWTYK